MVDIPSIDKSLGNWDSSKTDRICLGARFSSGTTITEEFKGIFHSIHFRDDNGNRALDLETTTTCGNLAGWYGLNAMKLNTYSSNPLYENWEAFMHGEPNTIANTDLGTLGTQGTTLTNT